MLFSSQQRTLKIFQAAFRTSHRHRASHLHSIAGPAATTATSSSCAAFRASNVLLHKANQQHWKYNRRYPYLVAFHQLPWNTIEPSSDALHKLLAPNLNQLVTAATAHGHRIPRLCLSQHPSVAPERALALWPGTIYILVHPTTSGAEELTAGVPHSGGEQDTRKPQWKTKKVTSPTALAHYGPLRMVTASHSPTVYELMSNDLRLCGVAVQFDPNIDGSDTDRETRTQKHHIHAESSVGTAFGKTVPSSSSFTLYYYYRPNRVPSELVKPFEKFYVPSPTPGASLLQGLVDENWAPAAKTRPLGETPAAPMPDYKPPTTPQYGLPDREAQLPGDCFGHRARQWGFRW